MQVNLDSLNPAQRQAVLHTEGPLLVLAGAGSGKTRVLTQRIAHMVLDEGIAPWQILAITFTNKAAAEMRERLESLIGYAMRGMWVCTFHSMCVRMLRDDAERIGYSPNFVIYDDDDSKRLVKSITEEFGIDPKRFSLAMIRSKISAAKNALIGAEEFSAAAQSEQELVCARVYRELEQRLTRANALDFDDLLVQTHRLLSQHPDVCRAYQQRFVRISVDEYQDTNHAQYEITKLLAQAHRCLMVVGDDDQSIYSWRGADISNILDFEKDYPEALVVKLEENYRSTGHILGAANAVVAKNSRRKSKNLYTSAGMGERVKLYQAADERDEGRWIASRIDALHAAGSSYDDIAVFYRTNAQSRILEDMMLRAGVPYKIVGGTRFFDRAEIRDVMAYLKLVLNPADDVSARRIINTPRRGIGSTSQEKIAHYAARHGISFFAAAEICVAETSLLSAKTRAALGSWTSSIKAASHYSGELVHIIEQIIEDHGVIASLKSDHSFEAQGRIENIYEFLNVAREFDESHGNVHETLESLTQLREAGLVDSESSSEEGSLRVAASDSEQAGSLKLSAFMEWLALRSDLDSLAGQNHAITMMTIHSAKGLEFDSVFVAGMEEGLFPYASYRSDPVGMEEERRLAYVAITRARKNLFLTSALTRRNYGSTQANPTSRFIREIPDEHVELVGIGSQGLSGTGWAKRGDRRGTYGSGRGAELYGGRVFGSPTRSSGLKSDSSQTSLGERSFGRYENEHESQSEQSVSYAVGDTISHKTFGLGTITAVDNDAIEVYFSHSGARKKLLVSLAPIVKIED